MTPPHAEANSGALGQAAIYTLATASQVLSTVILLPVITRWLTAAEFGEVAAGLLIMQAMAILGSLGLPAAITIAYFRTGGEGRARSLVASAYLLGLLTTILVYATGPGWAGLLFESIRFEGVVSRGVLLGFPLVMVTAAQALLRAQGQAWKFAALAVTNGLGGQATGVAKLALAPTQQPEAYLDGMLVASAIAAAMGLAWTRPVPIRRHMSQVVRWGLGLGIPVVPHLVALHVVALGDRVVLERLEGLEAVGRYQIAYLVGSIAIVILGAINNVWAPLIYGADERQRWLVLAESTLTVSRLFAIMMVAVGLAVPVGFRILAPGSYSTEDARIAATIVAASTLPFAWYLANAHVLFGQEKTRRLAWASPASAALNIILNFALIPLYGLVGAAMATTFAYLTQALLVQSAAARLAAVPWPLRKLSMTWILSTCALLGTIAVPVDGAWLTGRAVAAGLLGLGALRHLTRDPTGRLHSRSDR